MKREKTVRVLLENKDIIAIKLNEKIVAIKIDKSLKGETVDAYFSATKLNQIKDNIRYAHRRDGYGIYSDIMDLPELFFRKTISTVQPDENIVQVNIMESSQSNGRWICVHCFKTYKDEAEKLLKYWENL